MRKLWAQPLRRQLLIVIVFLFVPVIGAAIWSGYTSYAERREDLRDQARAMAVTVAALIDRDTSEIAAAMTDARAGARLHSLLQAPAALLPQGSVITVTDAESRIVGRSVDAQQFVGKRVTSSPRSLDAIPPAEEVEGVDGVRRMFGNAQTRQQPWTISVGIPIQVALGKAQTLWLRNSTISVLAICGWLLVALWLSRVLSRSVVSLQRDAHRLASGDFRPIEMKPMPTREFEELQRAFDMMVRRFNDTRATLDAQMAEERRMREELQSLQRQVIRQERLAAVGLLVSGVAHEINNPLQAILGFAELITMEPGLPDSVKDDLRLIQKESARACAIIRNMALFSRQQPGQPSPVRMSAVIGAVTELRQRRLESEAIELLIEDRSRQQVMAVPAELQQVTLNFVVNAEQAIVSSGRRPGRVTLRTQDVGDRVRLEVEDTGPGIDRQHEAKLFQPFFTTKPVGQGTGLGLSVSYGIIRSLGGTIGYRRAPAGGAIFYFELPAVRSDP